MTESEWLTATDPRAMVECLQEFRYDAARIPAFVATFAEDGRFRALLTDEMRVAFDDYVNWVQEGGPNPRTLHPTFASRQWMQGIDAWDACEAIGFLVGYPPGFWLIADCLLLAEALNQREGNPWVVHNDDSLAWMHRQADRLREVVGNPFRPVAFAASWRTDTAVALARTLYESREFGAMPILADALQDAGCDNEDILSHCREPREHVRGCWVVDLVLGKA